MIPLFTPEQVRAMDQRAFARGVAPLALMERAAGHLARTVVAAGGRGYGLRVGILCGKGNNGGDGLAAARRLLDAGAAPTVCLVAGADGLSGDAEAQLRAWRAAGGRLAGSVEELLAGADVLVDCLLGTGTRGEPRPPYGDAIEALNGRPGTAPVVACDLPSGVDANTGGVPGVAVRADITITLGAHKRGLWLWPARAHCGRLELGELRIVEPADEPAAHVMERADVARLVPPPRPDAHKRSRGVVVVLAGSPGMSGAATLVARGAMAAGAGLVTVATSALARHLVAPTVPEALTVALPDDEPDAAFEELAGALDGADALAIGPGLGHAEETVALVHRLVREVDVPVVLDADGLNAFRHEASALADHAAPLLVCTPHVRELERLVGPGEEDLWAQRIDRLPEKAKAWGAVLVAKGPGSLVAAPDGRTWVNPTGGASLATGGTGDVLTGMTATLVAQHAEPESVAAAVWLHGRAGELAGAGRRARAVTALDVAGAVPAALGSLSS
jgi:ADP-dependent NAD(P)H-hydrate dehydratase / NAD(P)H-hydrate epimerase